MKRRFKGFLFLSLLLASSNAFAGGGGGGGEGGPLLSDEDWAALCGYTGYAILVVLVLFVGYKLIVWATAPCRDPAYREKCRKARVWRDAMDALPKDDPPSAPPVSAD